MNNQVKLIDADKVLQWAAEMKFEGRIIDYWGFSHEISAGTFDPDTPPVPTIGCSECDYKGYFEYETGVVDEGTRIKEIAKEPCDCVIDPAPTIKPGDKVRHKDWPLYGIGTVISIAKSGLRARVEFKEAVGMWGTPLDAYYLLDKLEVVE